MTRRKRNNELQRLERLYLLELIFTDFPNLEFRREELIDLIKKAGYNGTVDPNLLGLDLKILLDKGVCELRYASVNGKKCSHYRSKRRS